jgi:putative inorganic carbon (HCO3(-)) transporter
VALVAAPALVAGDVWNTSRLIELRNDPAKLAVLVGAALAVVAVGAAVFDRLPWAFPVAAVVAVPLRVPLHIGGETSHLLVPLYLVTAAQLVRVAYRWRRGRPPPAIGEEDAAIAWLRRALAAMLVLYAIQAAYSADVSNAIENAGFFLVPFAVVFVLLAEVEWTERLVAGVLVAAVAIGLAFAGVAFWESATRNLLLSRGDLLQANQLHLYFRVNSLFFDPNVFGRYLALTLVALGTYLAWGRRVGLLVVAAVSAGVLMAALALTYSITGFIALVAGLVVVAALRWGLRWAALGTAAIVVCGAIFLLVSGTGERDLGSSKSVNQATSGRVSLVKGGLDLARDRPLWGWGSGAFGRAFYEHIRKSETTTSHSEPITVAAEQGAIGIVVYLAVVGLALVVLLSGAGVSAATAAVAGCFVAILVHSLGYAGFAIDPATWALLGLGVGLRHSASAAGRQATLT